MQSHRSNVCVLAGLVFLASSAVAEKRFFKATELALPVPAVGIVGAALNDAGLATGYLMTPVANGQVVSYSLFVSTADGAVSAPMGTEASPLASTRGMMINNAGQVAGIGVDREQVQRTFRYSAAEGLQILEVPGASGATPTDINELGHVAGFYNTATTPIKAHGFYADFGGPADLLHGNRSELDFVYAINDNGWAVGSSTFSFASTAAYWVDGAPSLVCGGYMVDINNANQMVGDIPFPGGGVSFVFQPSKGFWTIPVFAAGALMTVGINESGLVAGGFQDEPATIEMTAFVYQVGAQEVTPLPKPAGISFMQPVALNDAGHVIGVATGPAYDPAFAFFWSPQTGVLSIAESTVGLEWTPSGVAAINASGQILATGIAASGWPSAAILELLPPCAGDLNGDMQVDQSDLNLLLSAFGVSDGGDLNADGATDQSDLNELLANFGAACS